MKVEIKNGVMTITLPAETANPRVSASGKTRLVASDRSKGDMQVQGRGPDEPVADN